MTEAQIRRRLDAALGKTPCDLIIKDTTYLDVFTCQWRKGDVAIFEGSIVGLEPGLKGNREINGAGKSVVPGFIDAHVHVESSLLLPDEYQKSVLSRGTTTSVCDPHELANVSGISGIQYFLDRATQTHLDLNIMLSSCVPATPMETNGAGTLSAQDLALLKRHPNALGLAEVMNVPGVLTGSEDMVSKLAEFSDGVIDGHCPFLSGRELSAYIATGISSCHESTQLEEAREKLSKGMAVWIREGSVAKDLDALIPLLNAASSPHIGFCTDDRNPLDIATEGHLDYLLRKAIEKEIPAEVAYRSASWSVAQHYGLKHKGAVAPGYVGDLVLLGDAKTCAVETVLKAGTPVSEFTYKAAPAPKEFTETIRAKAPEPQELEGPTGRVHVIGVEEGKILTSHEIRNHNDPGVARLTVLERYGKGTKPSNGYALGFGEGFNGAIASSVGHDSHNLIVVGKHPSDMAIALKCLIESGGGFSVVQKESVLAHLALPFGGLMTAIPETEVVSHLRRLREASQSIGCALTEPFLQLAFLSLPVIPSLKLTDQGLVDVEQFSFISVAA